jgi:hypothetical protein
VSCTCVGQMARAAEKQTRVVSSTLFPVYKFRAQSQNLVSCNKVAAARRTLLDRITRSYHRGPSMPQYSHRDPSMLQYSPAPRWETSQSPPPSPPQGPAAIFGALAMGFGWGLLCSVLITPAYIGMWVTSLSVTAAMLYATFKLCGEADRFSEYLDIATEDMIMRSFHAALKQEASLDQQDADGEDAPRHVVVDDVGPTGAGAVQKVRD